MRRAVAAVALALLFAPPAIAQQRVERFAIERASAPTSEPIVIHADDERHTALLAGGGIAGGIVLGALGGLAGYLVGCGVDGTLDPGSMQEDDYCGFVAVPGVLLGEIVGIPLGVHLANRAAGGIGYDIIASLAAAIVGGGLLVLTGEGAMVALPFVLAGQLATVIAVERETADGDAD